MSNLLEIRSLKRTFQLGHATVPALRGVDLDIRRGEMLTVWGASGSGKSTLLNMIGLIDRPDEGSLRFDGDDTRVLSDHALTACRNRKIGFVFQAFNLVPVFSALENVMLPLTIQGVPEKEASQAAGEWLDRVGLAEFARHRPDRMSGGQRQRVAIARALVTRPMLVIADEPTANLDSVNSALVLDMLWQLSEEAHVTCVFATHDQRLLARAHRNVLLKDGQIVDYKENHT